MKVLVSVVTLMMLTGLASAQSRPETGAGTAPADHFTATNYYKQDVYNRADNKIGVIDDVLIDKQGKVTR